MDSEDYERFMSRIAKRRKSHRLRAIINQCVQNEGNLLSLAIGFPNPSGFPIRDLTLTIADGSQVKISEEEMKQAQQYWNIGGLKSFSDVIHALVRRCHNPPRWENCAVQPTSGGSDNITMVFQLILNEGDYILTEEFTYTGAISTMHAMGLRPIMLAMDEHGIIPSDLRAALSRWDPEARPGSTDKPKLLYVIPHGQNPTGATYTLERKQELYQIAKEYNLLIFEDEPYYLITFTENVPSFLSLDLDGRVLRGDGFGKIFAPGLRSGYLTGPKPLISKVTETIGCTSLGTSALSQTVIAAIINKTGIDGFLEHAKRVAALYEQQRNAMKVSADKWLKGLAEYHFPKSGMFFWMKINGITDSQQLFGENESNTGVLVIPGQLFTADDRSTPYIRVSYSLYGSDTFNQAFKKLAQVIKQATSRIKTE